MRILASFALFSGVLWAQTPPSQLFNPAPAPPAAATPGLFSNSSRLDTKQKSNRRFLWPDTGRLFSPQTPAFVSPYHRGEQEPIVIRPYVFRQATLPPAVCAIPLINVMPRDGFNVDPKIVIPLPKWVTNIDHMPVAAGLPACPTGRDTR